MTLFEAKQKLIMDLLGTMGAFANEHKQVPSTFKLKINRNTGLPDAWEIRWKYKNDKGKWV